MKKAISLVLAVMLIIMAFEGCGQSADDPTDSPENPVSDLTVEQIEAIYTGEITNWSEVGGEDGEIFLIGREAGSGTRDGFETITGTADACDVITGAGVVPAN